MTGFLRVKNWERFQHYKDRRPPWIKLHIELTDDFEFTVLADEMKYHLIAIWLLAARTDNKIPNDPKWVARAIGARKPVCLAALVEAGFLAEWKRASGKKSAWASRHIPKDVRAEILARDEVCQSCGSAANLEIDHIIPVSRGGNSTAENLQVLCRSCNRAKRARLSAEQAATQPQKAAEARGRDRDRGREEAERETEPALSSVSELHAVKNNGQMDFTQTVRTLIDASLGGAA